MIDKKTKCSLWVLALAPLCALAQTAEPSTESVPVKQEAQEEGGKKLVIELPVLPDTGDIKIKVSGLVQAQYVYATASGGDASDQNGFSVRRSTIGVSADVGDNWSGKIVYEFDSKSTGGVENNGYIDTAIISRKFSEISGTLTFGHKKAHFMLEEYSPSSKFPCLERSLNSNFVNGNKYVKGLSGYHIGIFWDGLLGKSFDYGLSLTNAVAKDYDGKSNDLAITGNVGYTLKFKDDVQLYFGVNGTVNFGDDGGYKSTALTNAGAVYGIEPYVRFKHGGFTALADCFYIDGDGTARLDPIYGVNLTTTYLFANGFEPALRFTYLNTDSGMVNANLQNRVPASGNHNNATTYYIGVNYYFNKYVKVAAGYEYGHYFGHGAHADDSGAFRTMVQISF